MIPLSIPNFEGNEKKYVDDAVEQGWVSTGGAYINRLEKQLATFLQVDDVAVCQSGTSALHMALVRCGVQPGDMVIVPTLTFIAAVNPVKYQFATPVFMDCDDSLCMDSVKLRNFCENECEICQETERLIYKKTNTVVKAVVVVHVFGNLADMEEIMDIAESFHLKVIEDATEALGTRYTEGKYKGRYAGTIGDYGTYSFNGNKIITTGGGGAIAAKEKGETEYIRYLSTQAKDDPHYYIHNAVGYNYRMTNVQAAIGVAQMEELSEFIDRKHTNYLYYKQRLEGNPQRMRLLPFRAGTSSNQWFYAVELPIERMDCELRTIIVELQEQKGIQTRPIWGLIHKQKPYENAVTYEIEKAKYYSERIINIPCSTQLTSQEMEQVVEALENVIGKHIN